jgi:phage terminase Nu1 subunit (DNA packaging protein)
MKRGASASEVARHLDLSAQRVGNMVNDGILKRRSDGSFDLDACRTAYIRWLRAAPQRRQSKAPAAARVQEAKARALELRLAKEEGGLIEIGVISETIEDIVGTFDSELIGIAAACSRDLEVRNRIEDSINAAITRCRKRFDQAIAALSRGEDPLANDAEDVA